MRIVHLKVVLVQLGKLEIDLEFEYLLTQVIDPIFIQYCFFGLAQMLQKMTINQLFLTIQKLDLL